MGIEERFEACRNLFNAYLLFVKPQNDAAFMDACGDIGSMLMVGVRESLGHDAAMALLESMRAALLRKSALESPRGEMH